MTTRSYRQDIRAQQTQANVDRIVRTAVALVKKTRRTADITLDDVSRESSVTVRTILRRFGSRDGVLEAAFAEIKKEFKGYRTPTPPGDIDAAVRTLVDQYERIGDVNIRALEQEHQLPLVHRALTDARRSHREWLEYIFGPQIEPLTPRRREARLTALYAATDVYLWKLLRRDLKLERRETEETFLRLVHGVLTPDQELDSKKEADVARFLFAHWEGGGNTPPMLSVVRRLLARGHAVRVLSDPCNRQDVTAVGASFEPWTRAPHRPDKSIDSDPLRDWEVKSPPAMVGRLRDRIFVGPSLGYAEDVLAELKRFPADAIVTSEMLLGVMAAAEAARVPCVALSANIYLFPQPGVPPFGPGLLPATNVVGRMRDWAIRTMTMRAFGKGTGTFNATRRTLGLEPLRHPFDQLERVTKHLVMTSAAFDFHSPTPSPQLIYAGAALDDPDWTEPWTSPWRPDDTRPLVLVGFSTTFQNQTDALRRVIDAVGSLDVGAVVTTGPSIDPSSLTAPSNVHVCRSAPHGALMQEAAAVVTHAGHGTVIRALAAGVPLVCMPMGRDQNENAARVVYHGVGLRLSPAAASSKIRDAIRTAIETPGYRERARALGEQIVRDARESPAVRVLEELTRKAKAS